MKLVIDTDVGTDPDDAFALAYAMKNAKEDIKAITTVHGKPEIRAKIARKLEKILQAEIPITAGETCSEEKIKEYWTGFEPLALTKQELQEPFQQHPFPEYDENTRLVCIGPLTNIALQIEQNPSIRNVREIYVMGSSATSHNFVVDPKATEKIFSQPWDIWQITKPVSKKIYFTLDELEKFRENELGDLLYDSVKRWLKYTGRTTAPMYDVLTVSAALGDGLVKFHRTDKNKFVSCDVNLKLKDKIVEAIKSS